MNLEKITTEVCKIAKEAGEFLFKERLVFEKDRVETKSANNFVSYVDKAAEQLIVARLSDLLNEASFVTEEETVENTEKDYCWIVDPLDGTTNFIHDNAPYCVSIALSYQSELLIGVVYEVCRNECFYAWKGGKAYLNGQTIKVSDSESLSRSFVQLGLPYRDKDFKPVISSLINELYGKANGIRINGSAAISLCYVAAGRFEVYAEAFINVWDFAAGALILKEAGGLVTDFSGNDRFMKGHHIIASNGKVHSEMASLLAPFPMD